MRLKVAWPDLSVWTPGTDREPCLFQYVAAAEYGAGNQNWGLENSRLFPECSRLSADDITLRMVQTGSQNNPYLNQEMMIYVRTARYGILFPRLPMKSLLRIIGSVTHDH